MKILPHNVLLIGRGYVATEFFKQLKAMKVRVDQISSGTDPIKYIKQTHPGYVINAAGYCGDHNIDDCEHFRARTIESNIVLPARLAQICEKKFIRWIHVSSGCLWYGNKTKRNAPVPWTEDDEPEINVDSQFYAGTKRIAELMIQGSFVTICRIRMPFSDAPHPRNLITKLIGYPMAMDGINSLTYLPEAVAAMIALLTDGQYGILHLTNPGYVSTHDIIEIITRYIKPEREWPIVSQERLLNPSMVAPRSTCILSGEKYRAIPGLPPLTPVRDAFIRACKAYASIQRRQ